MMRMSAFSIALNYLLSNEKGLEESPNDPGGITNFGISFRFLSNLSLERLKLYGIFEVPTPQTIRELTPSQVSAIYENEFWINAPFTLINDQSICNYVFDMAVNMGIAPAIKAVQRTIWCLTQNINSVFEDGILGINTLHLLNNYQPPSKFLSVLRSERAGDYRIIEALHPNDKSFNNGWMERAYTK